MVAIVLTRVRFLDDAALQMRYRGSGQHLRSSPRLCQMRHPRQSRARRRFLGAPRPAHPANRHKRGLPAAGGVLPAIRCLSRRVNDCTAAVPGRSPGDPTLPVQPLLWRRPPHKVSLAANERQRHMHLDRWCVVRRCGPRVDILFTPPSTEDASATGPPGIQSMCWVALADAGRVALAVASCRGWHREAMSGRARRHWRACLISQLCQDSGASSSSK